MMTLCLHRIESEDDPMCEVPVEDTAKKRADEMKELYGEDSANIRCVEMAMHVGFLPECNGNKLMWPVVPFLNSFSSAVQTNSSL